MGQPSKVSSQRFGEPVGDIADADSLDHGALGFMCGLEIHQQLASGKLHSRQPSRLYDVGIDEVPASWRRVSRRLRPSEGESGAIDVAARFEARRDRSFAYVRSPNAGLIELDEAPPEPHDADAVDIALTVASMLRMNPVRVLQAMRKTVVDGSNTSGFQRTTLVATNGSIETDGGDVGIDLLLLEEDSARKLAAKATVSGEQVTYTLDRLGIPLVEIATAPDVTSPDHAGVTAAAIGQMLRDTRRVRRGLGSIRQDLNVSIMCGDRVEIKGCQDLDWVPRIIRLEMARQLHLYRLANHLRSLLGLAPLPPDRRDDDAALEAEVAAAVAAVIPFDPIDLTEVFTDCDSAMVRRGLQAGASMLGARLPGLVGRLGAKTLDAGGAQMPRLGRELAGAARLAGVAGIFHSDELPDYGITAAEVAAAAAALGCVAGDGDGGDGDDGGGDAFVLCLAPAWQATLALESVIGRARLAWHRIPQEVRNVVVKRGAPEDGTTSPMRPLPGSARMYPETDVAPLIIDEERFERIAANLPPTQVERATRLASTDLSANQQQALLGAELDDLLLAGVAGGLAGEEAGAVEGGLIEGLPPLPAKAWGAMLLDDVREDVAEAMGLATAESKMIPWSLLAAALSVRESGGVTRDGLVPICAKALSEGGWPHPDGVGEIGGSGALGWLSEAAAAAGLAPAASGEIEAVVDAVLSESADLVGERGMAAMGPLMGVILGRLGGGADGKAVSAILRDRLSGD